MSDKLCSSRPFPARTDPAGDATRLPGLTLIHTNRKQTPFARGARCGLFHAHLAKTGRAVFIDVIPGSNPGVGNCNIPAVSEGTAFSCPRYADEYA
jgi:hypothetical protein